jgi:hypothetical protein
MWAKKPMDIMDGDYDAEGLYCMIPKFFYEFANDDRVLTIDTSWGGNPTFYNCDIVKLCNYLKSVVTSDTRLCFDNLHEGNILPLAARVHDIVQRTGINPTQIHCFSSGLNIEIYYDWCREHGIEQNQRVHFYGAISWAYYTQVRARKDNLRQIVNYEVKPKPKNFLCMNRVLRWHRYALLGLLSDKNLISDSYTSFFPNGSHGYTDKESLIDDVFLKMVRNAINDDNLFNVINNGIKKLDLPLKLNIEGNFNKNWVDQNDISYFNNSYFSLVTETFFFPKKQWNCIDETPVYFTEKIFKPIAMSHPFVLVNRANSLGWLRKIGYQTFHPYIDESYDTVTDDTQRLIAIVNEVHRLSRQTTEEWIIWQNNVKSIVEHNKNVFYESKKHEFAVVRPAQYQGVQI